jgi:antitoxin Phd
VYNGQEVIVMKLDTNMLMPLAEANRNFSKVVRMVEEQGMIVILRNNKPRYIVTEFKEYEEMVALREAKVKAAETV